MDQYLQLVYELLTLVVTRLGSDGSTEQDLLGVALLSMGIGAAGLHPTIWAFKNLWAATCIVFDFPGKTIRARNYRKYMEDKEKHDMKQTLAALSKRIEELTAFEKKDRALFNADDDTVVLNLDDDDDDEFGDLELLDIPDHDK